MVAFEPSVSDSLSHPLEEFAKGLGDYLKPNKVFQEGMQKALGSNPELVQQLADLEYNAPGTLNKMGFGQLGDIISQVPESAKSQFARQNRGEILDNNKKQLDLQGKQTGFSLDRLGATIDAIRNDPTLSADAIHKELTGLTIDQAKGVPLENALKAGELRHVNAEAGVEEAEAPVKIALAHRQTQLDQTIQANPQLQNYDAMKLVDDLMAHRPVPLLREYLSLPGGQQAFQHAQAIAELQAQRDATAANRALTQHGIDAEERAKIQVARQMQVTTRAGTLDAWRVVNEHPEQIETIQNKLKQGGMASLTQSEKDVLHAADAQQSQQDMIASKENRSNQFTMIAADANLRKSVKGNESQGAQDLAASSINSMLADKAKREGSEAFRVVTGAIPPVGAKIGEDERRLGGLKSSEHGVYYVDSNDRRVPDSIALAPNPTGLSADALQALTVLQGIKDPTVRKQQLDLMKSKRPDVYNAIKGRLTP